VVSRKENMEKQAKMGRPFLSGNPKKIKITIMLDEKEHQEIKEKASKNDLSISEYLRRLAKKDK
jgi:predicted DNA binding CopG/RHH family protein